MKNPIGGLFRSIAAQVKALGGSGRGGGTRKLAEARAAASGKTVGAEMRQVQRALKSGKAPAKQSPQVARVGAGAALRSAHTVHVGVVRVTYNTPRGPRGEGTRDLGTMTVGGDLADALAAIADKLDAGRIDQAEAQDQINEALLDAYGDLGGTLNIEDYTSGLEFE